MILGENLPDVYVSRRKILYTKAKYIINQIAKGNLENMNLKQLDEKISESSIVEANQEQISSDLGGEAVILNLKTGVYHGLNEVGALIWNLIQEPKAVRDIKQMLLQEYEVEDQQCDRDLRALLEDLLAAGLIDVKNNTTV